MYATGDEIDIWVVERALGQGGMGSVYRCHNRDAKRILGAIKVLDFGLKRSPKARARFVREAEILFSLSHPNIVKVRNVRLDCDPPYLEMEFVEGMSLERRLAPGPMEPVEAISIFGQLAGALSYLHARGIRHRDIKPSNILLGSSNVATLVDFGIATEEEGATLSEAGQAMGSVSYVPPEWVRLEQVDAVKWDVYALGVCLFESISGNNAFAVPEGGMTTQRFYQVLTAKQGHAPLDPGPHVPVGLRALIADMTQSDPERRIADAETVRMRLSQIDLGDIQVVAPVRAGRQAGGETMVPDTLPAAAGLPGGATFGTFAGAEGPKSSPLLDAPIRGDTRGAQARPTGIPAGVPVGALAAVGVLAMVVAATGVWWAFGEDLPDDAAKFATAPRNPAPNDADAAGTGPHPNSVTVAGNPGDTPGKTPAEGASNAENTPIGTDSRPATATPAAANGQLSVRPAGSGEPGGSDESSPDATAKLTHQAGQPTNQTDAQAGNGASATPAAAAVGVATKSAGQPVTGTQLALFLVGNPEWQREAMTAAGDKYLKGWVGATPPPGKESAPAVSVSWNLAKAYCAGRGGLADLHAPPTTWTEGASQPWMEYRQDNGNPVWRRDDGGTSEKLDPTTAGAFIGFRCAR